MTSFVCAWTNQSSMCVKSNSHPKSYRVNLIIFQTNQSIPKTAYYARRTNYPNRFHLHSIIFFWIQNVFTFLKLQMVSQNFKMKFKMIEVKFSTPDHWSEFLKFHLNRTQFTFLSTFQFFSFWASNAQVPTNDQSPHHGSLQF